MPTKPTIGQDPWGSDLYAWLGVVIADDGSMQAGVVTHANVAAANKDGTVTTPSMRTLGTGSQQAAAGDDARLTDQRTPLNNSVTSAKIVDGTIVAADISSGTITDTQVAAANKDGSTGVASMRTLGTGATQSAPGNDARFTKSAVFSRAGNIDVSTGAGRFVFPVAATIINVIISVGTAPTGSTIIVDVNLNGTTIFTTQANRPAIAISGNTATSATPNVTAAAAGNYLTVDIDQVGSTISGADLTVQVVFA